jgi:uncharacterized protein
MLNLLVAVVVAGAAPPSRAIDPAALAAATALVQQLDVRGQLTRSMDQNVRMMKQGVALRAMLAQQPGFIPAYKANKPKFDAALQKAGAIQAEIAAKVIRENIGAVVNAATKAYARNYSAAELKQLAEFYRTPVGQALYQRQGRVSAEISDASARLIGTRIDAGMQANAARMQAALAPLNAPPPRQK